MIEIDKNLIIKNLLKIKNSKFKEEIGIYIKI